MTGPMKDSENVETRRFGISSMVVIFVVEQWVSLKTFEILASFGEADEQRWLHVGCKSRYRSSLMTRIGRH